MWLLIFSLILFPSPNYSGKSEATVTSEQATAPPLTSGTEEVAEKPKKPLQLHVSTDDFYLDNPRIGNNPDRVDKFSKSFAKYSTVERTDDSDKDEGLDKTRSFSKTLTKNSRGSMEKDEETESEKLDRFKRSLSGSLSRDSTLSRFSSFSKSLTGSSRFSVDSGSSGSEIEEDEFESWPSRTVSKSSFISPDIDEEKELVVPSTPRSFIQKRKSYSAEDINLISAAIHKNFWLSLDHKVFTASVTPYKMIQLDPKKEIKPIVIEGYKMIRSVTVLRHSIRLPTKETIVEMRRRLPKLKALLKEASIRDRDLTQDTWWYSQEMEDWTMYDELADRGVEMKTLVREGKNEAINMGKRFATFYKDLLPKKFRRKRITVKFTDCPRTKDTAFSFIEGMYGKLPKGKSWYEEVKSEGSVLKYDSTCIVWKSFKKSDLSQYLLKNFINGMYVNITAVAVAARSNLRKEEFSVDDLILVYETCSYETSWRGWSPWCDLLTTEHMKVLEFAADLELFILAGYANVMNTKIPCKLYNDLMDNLLNNKNLKALFYVTHLTSILKFLAFLGLYHDIDIRLIKQRERYDPEVEERNWRTAYIGAFLTNITIILFEDEKKKLWIQVRHQERPVYIPLCPVKTELLCPLDRFEMIFERFSYGNCKFDEWCKKAKVYPPENGKYLQKSYSVGLRRKQWLKEEEEAEKKEAKRKEAEEKEAERNRGTAGKEHEKDYRRVKSAGNVEHATSLEKKLMTEAKNSKTGNIELGQQAEKSKEKGPVEGEAKKEHSTTEEESSEEMTTEESEEDNQPEQQDEQKKIDRTFRFGREFGDDAES